MKAALAAMLGVVAVAVAAPTAPFARALPPGVAGEDCVGWDRMAAASDVHEMLAASRCRELRGVERDEGAPVVKRIASAAVAFPEHLASADPDHAVDDALAGWALGHDLGSQGPLLVHAAGGRFEEAAIEALIALLGEARLDLDRVDAQVRFLSERERGFARALQEETDANLRLVEATGGCRASRRASRLRELAGAQEAAISLPYPQAWDRLLAIEEEGAEEPALPALRPLLDAELRRISLGRALRIGIDAARSRDGTACPAPSTRLVDPIAGTPYAWDPTRCEVRGQASNSGRPVLVHLP